MTDEAVIDSEGVEVQSLLMQWGQEWAVMIRDGARDGSVCSSYQAEIIGQAIVGALHQTSREAQHAGRSRAQHAGRSRAQLVENLTRFLTRALKPDWAWRGIGLTLRLSEC